MFLHAADAATHGYNSVLISSDDTDVFVICLAFSCRYTVEIVLEMWYQSTYKSPGRREISKITNACRALIGMHAYAGCDIVSTFAGRGKLSALKLLSTNKRCRRCQGLGDYRTKVIDYDYWRIP